MEVIEPIMAIASVASAIYSLCEKVKGNKESANRLAERVKALEELVRPIKPGKEGKVSENVEKTLQELHITLQSVEAVLRSFLSTNKLMRVLKSLKFANDLNEMNLRLDDAYDYLAFALQVKVSEEVSRTREDEVDAKKDRAELKQLLQEQMDKTDAMTRDYQELKIMMETLKLPSAANESIREIKPEELTYDYPKTLIMKTSTSEVYKAKYRGFNVAVKRFINQIDASPSVVRSFFKNEIENMKRFVSPNIVQMYGICVEEEPGQNPQFLIIMEYCAKGSLRLVLDSKREELSWPLKARMCLDAAQGLYRLHQTEDKSKVHGSVNSSIFLVDAGYTVKLGGLELAKTETSLRRAPKDKKMDKADKGISSLCYTCPEKLKDLSLVYCKKSEMFSFGIVMWEIVTRKKPFEGCSPEEILKKVTVDEFQEPIDDENCPESLRKLIDACRGYDRFQRPSIGELVDQLRIVVAQLEAN